MFSTNSCGLSARFFTQNAHQVLNPCALYLNYILRKCVKTVQEYRCFCSSRIHFPAFNKKSCIEGYVASCCNWGRIWLSRQAELLEQGHSPVERSNACLRDKDPCVWIPPRCWLDGWPKSMHWAIQGVLALKRSLWLAPGPFHTKLQLCAI